MNFVIRRERLSWHEGNENLRLLHVSDLHVKWSDRLLLEIEMVIDAERPDIVVLTGDYYDTPRGAVLCAAFIERVSSLRPVCWISGNHDRWFGAKSLDQLRAVSSAVCVDDSAWRFSSLAGNHYSFHSWKQQVKQSPAGRLPGERRIMLLHNPEEIETGLLTEGDLVLAGHLHGGQFILCQTRDASFFPGNLLYRWCCDRREVNGTTIIVSKGLGDTLPLRFRCPYELVMIEIV